MQNLEENIYDLILSYFKGEASYEEKDFLLEWVNLSETNKKVFQDSLRLYRRLTINASKDNINKEELWQLINQSKTKPNKRRWIKHISYAASILIIFISSITIYYINNKNESSIILSQPEGEQNYFRANLKLPNGTIVNLDNNNDPFIILDSSLIIKHENKVLDYSETENTNIEYNTLTVPRGAEYKIILADGTKVHLNSNSEITYPVSFTEKSRRIQLKGEAFFDVTKDTNKPFVVETDNMQIRVLGTSFNINSYSNNKIVSATLESGKIEVLINNSTFPIQPGQHFTLDKTTSQTNISNVDTELFTSWKDGFYNFRLMTLEDILNTLSVWYDYEVVFENDDAKEIEFTGKLKRFEHITNLLNKFQHTGDVSFEIKNRQIIVK